MEYRELVELSAPVGLAGLRRLLVVQLAPRVLLGKFIPSGRVKDGYFFRTRDLTVRSAGW